MSRIALVGPRAVVGAVEQRSHDEKVYCTSSNVTSIP
jgi:hypothetical protein